MSLNAVLEKQRQTDLFKFKDNLVYIVSFRIASAM